MTRKGFEKIDGVRLKVRDDGDDLVASVWIDGEKMAEILRSPIKFLGRPGGVGHNLFVDAAIGIFNKWLGSVTGVGGIQSFRQKPNYKGE